MPAPLPTRAEDMFCYGIYTASHVINRAYAPHLSRLGLTYPQYIVLTLLWETDDQRVSTLADALSMGTNTLTPLLKRLEALGHVTRRKGKQDARETYIGLTHTGRALQKEAPDITACMVAGTSLTIEELGELQRLLGRLRNGLADE